MQQGTLLYEKEIDRYRPLGAFGQPVHRSFVQLRAAVAQRLGPRCANLFARPQFDERARTIRWISPVPGPATAWRDLAPEEQAERALDLQILRGEFESYLAELRQAGGGDKGGEAFSSVLEQSLKTPNDGHLHFVDDQPVMTFWGFTELNGDLFEPLTAGPPLRPAPALAEPAAAATAVAASEEPRGWVVPAWLWWLLPLLLLLLLLALLLWRFWWDDERAAEVGPDPVRQVAEERLPDEPFRVDPDRTGPDGRPVIVDRDGNIVDPRLLHVDRDGRVIAPNGTVIDGVEPGALGLVTDPAVDGDADLVDPAITDEMLTPGGEVAPDEPAPDEPAPGAEVLPGTGDDVPAEDPAAPATPEPPLPQGDEEPGGETPGEAPTETRADETQAPPETGLPPVPETGETPGAEEAGAGEPLHIPPAEAGDAGAGAPASAATGPGRTGPAGFMRGRWSSNSALADEQGNRLSQTYRFDDQGAGQSVIRRADGSECTAPATARMEDGRLLITEQGNPTCPDGRQFEKSETVCEVDAGGQTRCRGSGYDVEIERAGE